MSKPLVSVVMAVRNCEKFIKESLYSIKNQDFKDFEVILYDDASEDRTHMKAEEILISSGMRYVIGKFISGSNSGCGQTRNKAIKMAKGKYIAIQDGDDISAPHRLRKEVKFLEENSDIFCVSSMAEVIDEKGKFLEYYTYPPVTHKNIKKDILNKKINPIIDPASMFRRDLFNELGGYDDKWLLVPDFNLWVRAILKGYNFANIGDYLIYYRIHGNSNTVKYKQESIKEHVKMCKELL